MSPRSRERAGVGVGCRWSLGRSQPGTPDLRCCLSLPVRGALLRLPFNRTQALIFTIIAEDMPVVHVPPSPGQGRARGGHCHRLGVWLPQVATGLGCMGAGTWPSPHLLLAPPPAPRSRALFLPWGALNPPWERWLPRPQSRGIIKATTLGRARRWLDRFLEQRADPSPSPVLRPRTQGAWTPSFSQGHPVSPWAHCPCTSAPISQNQTHFPCRFGISCRFQRGFRFTIK